ncbi:streptomycin biosynthesis protein [Streptomyces sp. NPDC050619]|uniref:streptomycin biosynthesis protein n=1 Tax=Streptomyces sp. NPDC050619 TaxID=3157214 RepID=UPI00343D774C
MASVNITELILEDSPRHHGIDPAHVHVLQEAGAPLPPILVQVGVMRVIDGMHRVRAAMAKGAQTIEARLFDGSYEEAYVLAVKLNTEHGLPLSLSERRSAALRVMNLYPDWSDRAVATTTGLSAKTIAKIRRSMPAEVMDTEKRVGKDGRSRSMRSDEGRVRASQVIAARPDASLREIARIADISPNTARDVRRRMRNGESPAPRHHEISETAQEPSAARTYIRQVEASRAEATARPESSRRSVSWARLQRDPSLRLTEAGRFLLRALSVLALDGETWDKLAQTVPSHCVYDVAELARHCAAAWEEFARRLEVPKT